MDDIYLKGGNLCSQEVNTNQILIKLSFEFNKNVQNEEKKNNVYPSNLLTPVLLYKSGVCSGPVHRLVHLILYHQCSTNVFFFSYTPYWFDVRLRLFGAVSG